MEAICLADFDARMQAQRVAEEALEQAKKACDETARIVVPEIGYHDCYGIWFSGQLRKIIQRIGSEKFSTDLSDKMHVFMDVEINKIDEGIHALTVYSHQCKLYKWMLQGYHRGLVVLADDMAGNQRVENFRQSGTWTWILPELN